MRGTYEQNGKGSRSSMSQENSIGQDTAHQRARKIATETLGALLSRLDKLPLEVKGECPEISQSEFETIEKAVAIARDKIKAHPVFATMVIQ